MIYAMEPEDYAALGRILRLAREERRCTLAGAATAIHIRARYLEALEAGSLELLPGSAYVKGYLQQYARFLKLPEAELMAAYERIGALPPRRFFSIPDTLRREEKPSRALTLAACALSMAVVAYASYERRDMHTIPVLQAKENRIYATARACTGGSLGQWPPCYYREIRLSSPFMTGLPLSSKHVN